jgi:tellurite resistance protein TerC
MMDKFHYLKYGLALVLMFVGGKMLLAGVYKIPIWASLAVIAALLAGAVIASLLRRPPNEPPGSQPKPASGGAARKVGVAIAGGVVLAVGVAMIILPGPAFIVIPIGLTILASEFEWPRQLLVKVKDRARVALHKHRPHKHET